MIWQLFYMWLSGALFAFAVASWAVHERWRLYAFLSVLLLVLVLTA